VVLQQQNVFRKIFQIIHIYCRLGRRKHTHILFKTLCNSILRRPDNEHCGVYCWHKTFTLRHRSVHSTLVYYTALNKTSFLSLHSSNRELRRGAIVRKVPGFSRFPDWCPNTLTEVPCDFRNQSESQLFWLSSFFGLSLSLSLSSFRPMPGQYLKIRPWPFSFKSFLIHHSLSTV
jgi:hypothetical protein